MERNESDLLSRAHDEQTLMRGGKSSFIRKLQMRRHGLHVLMTRFEAMEARFILCPGFENQKVPAGFLRPKSYWPVCGAGLQRVFSAKRTLEYSVLGLISGFVRYDMRDAVWRLPA